MLVKYKVVHSDHHYSLENTTLNMISRTHQIQEKLLKSNFRKKRKIDKKNFRGTPKKRPRLLYRPMKKKVKGDGWLTGLSRYNE